MGQDEKNRPAQMNRDKDRLEAEAQALRGNLAKRKAQARGRRAAKPLISGEDDTAETKPD